MKKNVPCKLATLLVGFFACMATFISHAQPLPQKITLSGTVTSSETQQPIPNASVVVRGAKKGVVTDAAGKFSIQVEKGKVIEISYVGFDKSSITANKTENVKIELQIKTVEGEDVVVIGYGTIKKSSLTGAVSKYKNDKLDELPVTRLDQAIQGKIAGVQVQNITSESGADARIRIRGITSVNASSDPLVVVDGQPIADGLSFVNLADVESVEVLKDAASAAIYGSRGAGGVILITTKSGKAERTKYTFKYSAGAKNVYKKYNILSSTQYLELLYREAALINTDPSVPMIPATAIGNANERAAYIIEQTLRDGQTTNWQDEATRTGISQNVQIGASGGKKDLKYYLSAGYNKDESFLQHNYYDKFNIRSKLDINLSPKIKLNINVNPSYTKRERPSAGYTDFYRFLTFLPVYHTEKTAAFVNQPISGMPFGANVRPGDFAQARHFNTRSYSGTLPDGSTYTTTNGSPFNTANNTPKSILESRKITSDEYRIQGGADITINLAKGLDFKTLASSYINIVKTLDFSKRNSGQDGNAARGVYGDRTIVDLLNENTLTYNTKIKKHSINVLGGFTTQKTKYKQSQVTGLDYPSDNITALNTALLIDQSKTATYDTLNTVGLVSILGRVNYDFDRKYLVSATFRADESSLFAPGKRWGYFPSLSLGWVATEEKFLQDIKWLNKLKLRASYGITGNNRINPYSFVDLLFPSNYILGAGTGLVTTGQAPTIGVLANPDITWENTYQYNFGLDITLFKNIVDLSINAYQSRTGGKTSNKLLLNQASLGVTGVTQFFNNIGSLQNRGLEVEVTTNNITKANFKWTTSANISFNRNKILEFGKEAFLLNQGERTELYLNKPGNPLIKYFGFKTDGVWLSQAQIDGERAKGLTTTLSNLFVPGGLKIIDLNGDNVIDNNDRTDIGSPYPEFTWGITNSFSYKNLDLTFSFQGVQGGQLINGDANYNETKRYNTVYTNNRWLSPANPGDGKTPYSTNGFANWLLTDKAIESATYFTLRDVNIGYKLPRNFIKKLKLNGIRLYATAQNLFFITAKSYTGINTEARSTSSLYASALIDGYQRGGAPTPRTFLFGIDVNF